MVNEGLDATLKCGIILYILNDPLFSSNRSLLFADSLHVKEQKKLRSYKSFAFSALVRPNFYFECGRGG